MPNQHPGLSFALPTTALSIGTRVRCHHDHEMSAQLVVGQANTYYPHYSGGPHAFLPTHGVRRRSSVSCPLTKLAHQDTYDL